MNISVNWIKMLPSLNSLHVLLEEMTKTKQVIYLCIYLVRSFLKLVLEVCMYVNISVNMLLPEMLYFIENILFYFELQKDNF